MKIGITGHQRRPGIDWGWVESRLSEYLRSQSKSIGFSSLAAGSDQLFAEQVLLSGNALVSVIPIPLCKYRKYFYGADLDRFEGLLSKSENIQMENDNVGDEEAFLRAGLFIANEVDILIAIWDGKAARGIGGTADVVCEAQRQRKHILHINPIKFETKELFE